MAGVMKPNQNRSTPNFPHAWREEFILDSMTGSNKGCHSGAVNYTRQVRLKWKILWLAIPAAFVLFGAGCGGVNTGGSVSPASFFLPGLMRNDAPVATNAPVARSESSFELVSAH